MYKLCVFDMDGTVVNSVGDIAAAMNRSLVKMGRAPYETEAYCHFAGDGMEMLCRRAIGDASESEVRELIDLYKSDYFVNCCENSRLYDGIADVISALHKKGIRCAILSNKPHEQVMRIAGVLFEEGMFDEIMGYTPKFPTKPAPDSLIYIMERFGVDRTEVAYIGDSNVDIRLGKAAGVFSIGVAWGFRGEEELVGEGADVVVKNTDELLAAINHSVTEIKSQ